jgi:hypothetical protein
MWKEKIFCVPSSMIAKIIKWNKIPLAFTRTNKNAHTIKKNCHHLQIYIIMYTMIGTWDNKQSNTVCEYLIDCSVECWTFHIIVFVGWLGDICIFSLNYNNNELKCMSQPYVLHRTVKQCLCRRQKNIVII